MTFFLCISLIVKCIHNLHPLICNIVRVCVFICEYIQIDIDNTLQYILNDNGDVWGASHYQTKFNKPFFIWSQINDFFLPSANVCVCDYGIQLIQCSCCLRLLSIFLIMHIMTMWRLVWLLIEFIDLLTCIIIESYF